MNDHKISDPLGRDIASSRVFIGLFFSVRFKPARDFRYRRDSGFNTRT